MTDTRHPVERMYAAGLTDLIPVIPPGASLAPKSQISPSAIGKIPGRRNQSGLWGGFDWRNVTATPDDLREWLRWGANIGLRADRFPGVDIDCADANLASMIEQAALGQLGPAPVRVGNPPKRLLPYTTSEPFGRMRLWFRRGDVSYLVEILGQGQQYLVHGTHPSTLRPYEWSADPAATPLTSITREQAGSFLDHVAGMLTMLGYEVQRIGDGSPENRTRAADQQGLMAPNIDELRAAVAVIPNSLDIFPGWDEYVKMLHALRAAAGPDEDDGLAIFDEWAARWEGHGTRHADSNDPQERRSLWRRTRGPFAVGWSWIAEMARPFGYNDAPFETRDEPTAPTEHERAAPYLSDQWLALKVVEAANPILRFVPAEGTWRVWSGGKWQPDAEMLAEDIVKGELRKIAVRLDGQGGSAQEQAKNIAEARAMCSGGKASAVRLLVQSDRDIALKPEAFDYDKWVLNTPGGIVDLTTGELKPHDPDMLCSKASAVTPEFGAAMPEWERFLDEATNGDRELQGYLQRLGGYCLTGSTREHQYTFVYGPGGNGKGTFLGVLNGILGDYAKTAPMDTFIESHNERHATELAGLMGARLVSASETSAGKRWNEERLKAMTGGDPISARFMRQDFFTYKPQFKLVFIGNHRPEIRNLDPAMARRTHLVPFLVTPKVVDKQLDEKLQAEWPAILAWFIEGCLAWQRDGLNPPATVRDATQDYLTESDPITQWIGECCDLAPGTWTETTNLFDSWREWANRRGEYVGKMARLTQILASRKFPKRKHPTSRRSEIGGLVLTNRQDSVEQLTA